MADLADTRRWWPAFLLEEIMPPGREKPEHWLEPDPDGITTVWWDEDENGSVAGTMSPGETVAFLWYEKRGSATVRIMPDGKWSFADDRDPLTPDLFTGETLPDLPHGRIEDANWFYDADEHEMCEASVDALARVYAEMETIGADGVEREISMGKWSDEVQFVVSADGGSLTPAGGEHG